MIDEDRARHLAVDWYGLGTGTIVKRLTQGRVNLSFIVISPGGPYILQRLHPIFGRDGAVVYNAAAVSESLTAAGFPCSAVVPGQNGMLWAESAGIWRLMTWLPGSITDRRDEKTIKAVARFLGLFHQALRSFPPHLRPLPPADYNREGLAPPALWDQIIHRHRQDPKFPRAAEQIERCRELVLKQSPIHPVTEAFLHGDPKLDNFLFDPQGKVTALIDLDTVRHGWLLWELADALRSWSALRLPGNRVRLDVALFLTTVGSYRRHGLPLEDREWRSLPAATRATALNLTRRYLMDYFEEAYFSWDREKFSSLADQNLARAQGMLQLAEDLERAEQEIVSGIDSV